MLFHTTSLEGVLLIEPEQLTDNRGFFARAFSRNQFKERGLEENFHPAISERDALLTPWRDEYALHL